MDKATFAGGCFWCMVKPFDQWDGIGKVTSGYMGGHTIAGNLLNNLWTNYNIGLWREDQAIEREKLRSNKPTNTNVTQTSSSKLDNNRKTKTFDYVSPVVFNATTSPLYRTMRALNEPGGKNNPDRYFYSAGNDYVDYNTLPLMYDRMIRPSISTGVNTNADYWTNKTYSTPTPGQYINFINSQLYK